MPRLNTCISCSKLKSVFMTELIKIGQINLLDYMLKFGITDYTQHIKDNNYDCKLNPFAPNRIGRD